VENLTGYTVFNAFDHVMVDVAVVDPCAKVGIGVKNMVKSYSVYIQISFNVCNMIVGKTNV
jgi:hypothetical protein